MNLRYFWDTGVGHVATIPIFATVFQLPNIGFEALWIRVEAEPDGEDSEEIENESQQEFGPRSNI